MHNLAIFAIYDSKAEAFLTPFFSPTVATAVRSFEAAVNDPEHDMHNYAEDYCLFQVGDWAADSGAICPTDTPISITRAQDLLKNAEILKAIGDNR